MQTPVSDWDVPRPEAVATNQVRGRREEQHGGHKPDISAGVNPFQQQKRDLKLRENSQQCEWDFI